MLFWETVAVYCENHTEHKNTLCGQNAEFWYVKADGIYVTVKARRLVNPSIYHSEVVKVRKMLVNASISGFYQTSAVSDGIYQHQLVKARFV
jgi:hypothetical protein